MARRPPPLLLLEGLLSSARRKPTSRRHYSSRRKKPNARTLSPQRLNWLVVGKALLKHPLERIPNHTSITNPTNKSNSWLALKGGAGKSQPKES